MRLTLAFFKQGLVKWLLKAVPYMQFFLGPTGGYRCDEPAKTLADMNHLRAWFNEDAGGSWCKRETSPSRWATPRSKRPEVK